MNSFKFLPIYIFLSFILFLNLNKTLANCVQGDCFEGFGTWEGEDYKYTGQFKDGYFNGQGTTVFEYGDIHIGGYKDDLFNGKGVYTFVDGDIYNGDFKNDKRDGFGIYLFNTGSVYEGEWKENNYHGYGKYTFYNGEIYEGEYKNNQRNGYGILYLESGNIYEGQFLNDEYDGYGVFTFVNGDIYEGDFKNSKYNGYGKFTYSDGEITEGYFENNEFINSTNLNTNKDDNNFVQDLFNIEITQKSIREFIENSGIEYEVFEFIDDNSFSIKNIYSNDGITELNIGEITILDLDFYAINKIKLNSDLSIKLFDKFIIRDYYLIENDIEQAIEYTEISNLNFKNSSLIYEFLNSPNLLNFDTFDDLKNIFYILDTLTFDKVKINGARIKEIDSYGEWKKFEFTGFENMIFDKILLTDFYFDDKDAKQKGEILTIKDLEFNRPQNMTVFDINDSDFVFSILKYLDSFSAKNFWYIDKNENITLNSELYEISNYNTIDFNNLLFPISLDFSLKNTYFSDFDPEIELYLNILGYDNLVFDFDFNSSIDYQNDEFKIYINTSVYEALNIETNFLFSNLNLEILNYLNESELIDYFSNEFTFNSFEINLTDYGLTDKMFLFLEDIYGLQKEDIIDFLLLELNNDRDLQNSIDIKYINKILDFVNNPSSLKFSINPYNPISYNDILLYSMDPASLIDILNINLN